MPINPKKLNALQLRTLAVLQLIAEDGDFADPPAADGSVTIRGTPQPHGDHVHLADGVVPTRAMSGLDNANVMKALARKGLLAGAPPQPLVISAEGRRYETGLRERTVEPSDH